MGDALARFVFASATSLAVLTGGARGAQAQPSCGRLVAPPALPAEWADAVGDLARALAGLPSTECRPLTLTLESDDGAIRLIAEAPDGQRAVRTVTRPSLLVPIALGLVVSGSTEAAEDSRSTSPPTSAPSAAPPPPLPPSTASLPAGDAPTPHVVSVWIGIGLGARVGVPSTISMGEIEGRGDLRVDRLLLFVSFRNVPIGFVAGQGFDGDAYHESSFAIGAGRSFPLGHLLLDLSLAPSLVTMRMSKDGPTRARANDVELRVSASARLNVPLSANWRLTLSADTDVIPDFLRSEEQIAPLPAFPSWTSGLCVGVSGEIL
jgi:hypothetical protein